MKRYAGIDIAQKECPLCIGAKTTCIEPCCPWKNRYCKSFNARLLDELFNDEIFYSLGESQILIEQWLVHDNTVRPHSALASGPPAARGR